MSIFSERLRNLRNRNGETQGDLGKLLGKSREAVAKYEVGKNEPDLDVLSMLARHYGVSTDYIIGANDSEYIAISANPDIKEFEAYLHDKSFVPYARLAVRIKDSGIDIKDIEDYIEDKLKSLKKDK